MELPTPPAWHQALAYAATGRRYPELGRQRVPDVASVARFLQERWARHPDERVDPAQPHPLPPELAEGIGAAQLWAAASSLRRMLAQQDRSGRPEVPVVADRPLSADEQRLLRDVPPHHGS